MRRFVKYKPRDNQKNNKTNKVRNAFFTNGTSRSI
jgi:hypothetical protein